MQDLLSTALDRLDSPTLKRPLDVPTCSAPSPLRLRAAQRLAALAATERPWRRLSGGSSHGSAAPWHLRAQRLGGSAAPSHAAVACCGAASAPALVQRRIKGRGG